MFQEYDPRGVAAYTVLLVATTVATVLWLRVGRDRATASRAIARTGVALVTAGIAGYLTSAALTAVMRETFCLLTMFAVATIGGGLAAVFLTSRIVPMKRSAYIIVLAIGTAEVLVMPRLLV